MPTETMPTCTKGNRDEEKFSKFWHCMGQENGIICLGTFIFIMLQEKEKIRI